VIRTRDSGCLEESNFQTLLKRLRGLSSDGEDERETFEVHRFSHWGPGWFEIILIDPSDAEAVKLGTDAEDSLEGYPILDEFDFSERETEEANRVWSECYSDKERIAYIRDHESQFEFHDMADMISCVRGHHFAGYASELL